MKNDMISRLYFRLLPLQLFMLVIAAVNGFVSGLFAGNFIGQDALTVVGLFSPIVMPIAAVSAVFLGGSQILAGKLLARSEFRELDSLCSLDMLASAGAALLIGLIMAVSGAVDLFSYADPEDAVRRGFDIYMIIQAAGLVPLIAGQQMFAFLSLEQRNLRTAVSIATSISANILFDYVFICVFHMGTTGLALASVIGNTLFAVILLQYFFTKKATLKIRPEGIRIRYLKDIVTIGMPGALNYLYQMARGFKSPSLRHICGIRAVSRVVL